MNLQPFSKLESMFCAMIRVYGQNTRQISVLRSESCSVWEASAPMQGMRKNLAHQEETERAQENQKIGATHRESIGFRPYTDRLQGKAADWKAPLQISPDAPVVPATIASEYDSARFLDAHCRWLVVQLPRSALGAVSASTQVGRRYRCLLSGSRLVAWTRIAGTLAYGNRIYPRRHQGTDNSLGFRWISELPPYCTIARLDFSALPFPSHRPTASQSGKMETEGTRGCFASGVDLSGCANCTDGERSADAATGYQATAKIDHSAPVPSTAWRDCQRISAQPRFLPFLSAISGTQLADYNQYRGVHEQPCAQDDSYVADAGGTARMVDGNDSNHQEIEMQWTYYQPN